MKTADVIENLVLPTSRSEEIRLGDMWRDRPAVLVWLRHYG